MTQFDYFFPSCSPPHIHTHTHIHKHTLVDVAVIDEVQMIKDYDRGGAWTKAILGIPAAEVHLCGHQCAVNLLERITDTIGEKLEVSVVGGGGGGMIGAKGGKIFYMQFDACVW